MSQFSLTDLLYVRAKPENEKEGTRTGRRPILLSGIGFISREKKRLNVNGDASHTNYLIDRVLDLGIYMVCNEPESNALRYEYAMKTYVEGFQNRQIDLIKAYQNIRIEAEQASDNIKEVSQERRTIVLTRQSGMSLTKTLLFCPERCTQGYLWQVALHSAMAEKRGQEISEAEKQAVDISRQWLRDQDKRLRMGKVFEVSRPRAAFEHLKNIAKNNADAQAFAQQMADDISVVERAMDVRLTLGILERQLDAFYKWRKSDGYKNVMNAFEEGMRMEKRLSVSSMKDKYVVS